MKTTHTPGPWEIRWIESEDTPRYFVGTRTHYAARAWSSEDARLIAAAPEMLEALKTAKQCLKENRGPSMDEFMKIQEAIAKAEGKQ